MKGPVWSRSGFHGWNPSYTRSYGFCNTWFQLEGYRGNSTIPVHVFVSNEKGQIKPHIFFRSKFIWNLCAFFNWNFSACKIASRNSTPCDDDEFILNGQRTDAIRINLSPKDDFTAIVDCVGILKLRNAGNFSYLKFSKFLLLKFWIIFWKILKTSRTSPNRSHSQNQNVEIRQSVWLFMPLSQILIQVNQICHWWLHQTQ